MTRICIRIEHKNLPLGKGNFLDNQLSPEEIEEAVNSFEQVLSTISSDNTLTVAKQKYVIGRETIYIISSSLQRADLIAEIEKVMSGLKLGGFILKSTNEVEVGISAGRFIDPKV